MFHSCMVPAAGQQVAVGAERYPVHAARAACGVEGRAEGLAGDGVPQPHRALGVCAGQQLAIGAERHVGNTDWVSGQDAVLLSSMPPTANTPNNAFIDPGDGHVHIIRDESGAVAKTVAVQFIPAGATRRQDEPDPG